MNEIRQALLEVRQALYAISIQIPEAGEMVDDALQAVVECEKSLEKGLEALDFERDIISHGSKTICDMVK